MAQILIVEDEPELLGIFSLIITRRGYNVDAVYSLKEAIKAINNKKYDTIVSDVNLLDGNGFDIKFELNKLNKLIPIIFVTGMPIDIQAFSKLGMAAVSYLQKPVLSSQLISTVETGIRLSKLINKPTEAEIIANFIVIGDFELFRFNRIVREIPFSRTITIGRYGIDSYCDYQVKNRATSRHHLTFVRHFAEGGLKDGCTCWDGEIHGDRSANGVRVNGKRISYLELKPDDIVEIPGLVLQYKAIDGDTALDEKATLV
jgi:DNA-binding response OmpR family regulator